MKPPSAHREWVDWTQPLAPAAARWLQRAGSSRSGFCDLTNAVCVVPGKRAGRVILEALLRECESQGLSLLPPRFITPGALPEVLADGEPRAIASPEEARLAWVRALQSCEADIIRPLIPSPLAASGDLLAWNALAEIIQNLHDELAGALLSFNDVADRAARLELFGESDRWAALDHVYRAYLKTLAGANLHDAHQARIDSLTDAQGLPSAGALDHANPPRLILIGVVELNALQRRALARAADITALIHAPPEPEFADHFDALGCVIPERWTERTIDLHDEQIIIADKPDDQSQAVLHVLAASHQAAPVDTITIGLGDDSLGESIVRATEWAKVSIHRAEAMKLSRTAPYMLLEAMRDWIAEERFAPFASLLRHPDVERWLGGQSELNRQGGHKSPTEPALRDWITLLDRYFADHLHKRFAGDWLGDPEHRTQLKRIHDAVRTLASSLLSHDARPLADWINPTLDILQQIYLTHSLTHPHTDTSRDACHAIRDRLESFALIVESLQPTCNAATALTLFLEACANESLTMQPRDDQVEVLGWLELHLDAAPNLIVMGVNDGSIPKSITADPFLPNSLREALGLPSNTSRYARDVYLLEAMNRSRESVTLIAGRRGREGDPLTPSRLLLACRADELPQRILRLSDDDAAFRAAIPIGAPQPAKEGAFTIYRPVHGPDTCAIEVMHVTSFKRYLQCPFRWWLQSVQKLSAIEDGALELDPLSFGRLAHDVLESFARDEAIRDCSDSIQIAQWLSDRLDRIAIRTFGDRPPPAVRIQVERLRRRLEAFALFQARSRAAGWRIVERELKIERVPLDIPGQQPIHITGKIDRIDEMRDGNGGTGGGRYRIIDYKTSESPDTPFQTHHGRKTCDPENWIDLQLPLYRHLATHAGFKGQLELGYIVLPRDPDRIDFVAGQWSESDHEAAIECARDVVRRIRAGEFPMSDDVDARFDEFANICQTNVRGRAAMLAAERAAAVEGAAT